jgi:tRNA(Ile2) C34 agmatinyltransferase TiaS
MEKPPKKCPVCNSSRVTVSSKGFECKRCGYVNKEVKQDLKGEDLVE